MAKAALIAFLLAAAAFAAPEEAAFEDKFDSGNINGWHAVKWVPWQEGDFDVGPDALKISVNDYAGGMTLAPDFTVNETYYVIEADVRIDHGHYNTAEGGAGPNGVATIGALYGSGQTGHFITLTPYEYTGEPCNWQDMCIVKYDSSSGRDERYSAPLQPPTVLGKWYRLRFERDGAVIRGYVDGKKIVEQNVGERPPGEQARPIIYVFEGKFNYDNFRVYTNRTPELEIADRKVDAPAAVPQNGSFTASATIRNRGMGNATAFDVAFYSRTGGAEKEECRKRVERLDAGRSTTLACVIKAPKAGYMEVTVFADDGREIAEKDETDNSASARVLVTPPPEDSIYLFIGAGCIAGLLLLAGAAFAAYKAAAQKGRSGEALAKCTRCGMMLSQATKKCPVCGEALG